MSLAANAMTDYATVAAELGLSGSTDQTLIERLIGAASTAIETYCRRKLAFQAGIVEQQAMRGGPTLLVERTPFAVLGVAALMFGSLDPTNVRIDDAEAGSIWSDVGWPWSALIRAGRYDPNFTYDQQPQTEERAATITYAGGYVTGPQAYGAKSWAALGGAGATLPVGSLCIPAGQPAQLWMATPTVAGAALVTGGVEPTWPASPTQNLFPAAGAQAAFYGGTSLVDGGVTWLYLGTCGAAGARGTGATLPQDIEEACVIAARAYYRGRKRDPGVKSQSVLGASQSWFEPGELPPAAMALVNPYRRGD